MKTKLSFNNSTLAIQILCFLMFFVGSSDLSVCPQLRHVRVVRCLYGIFYTKIKIIVRLCLVLQDSYFLSDSTNFGFGS